MSVASDRDVTELLRSLPEMRPPADAWSRIRASRPMPRMKLTVGALAASLALAAVITVSMFEAEIAPVASPATGVSVVAGARDRIVPVNDDLRELRRQSRQMERLLAGLPPRGQVVRADVAGVISELQDRIAAVDYELNRAAPMMPGTARWPETPSAAFERAEVRAPQDLWRERVELMDRLVRVRFVEAGAAAY